MKFSERMRLLLDQGLAASKEIAAKAQDLGEKGVLTFEIRQLEGQAQKLLGRLGNEAYSVFTEQEEKTLSAENENVKGFLTEIAALREVIEKKEAELDAKKNSVKV